VDLHSIITLAQAHARDGQTRARRMISLGPSAGRVRSRVRMSEHETPVVVRTWMSNQGVWGGVTRNPVVGVGA
jgi:hypothetical protein